MVGAPLIIDLVRGDSSPAVVPSPKSQARGKAIPWSSAEALLLKSQVQVEHEYVN